LSRAGPISIGDEQEVENVQPAVGFGNDDRPPAGNPHNEIAMLHWNAATVSKVQIEGTERLRVINRLKLLNRHWERVGRDDGKKPAAVNLGQVLTAGKFSGSEVLSDGRVAGDLGKPVWHSHPGL